MFVCLFGLMKRKKPFFFFKWHHQFDDHAWHQKIIISYIMNHQWKYIHSFHRRWRCFKGNCFNLLLSVLMMNERERACVTKFIIIILYNAVSVSWQMASLMFLISFLLFHSAFSIFFLSYFFQWIYATTTTTAASFLFDGVVVVVAKINVKFPVCNRKIFFSYVVSSKFEVNFVLLFPPLFSLYRIAHSHHKKNDLWLTLYKKFNIPAIVKSCIISRIF